MATYLELRGLFSNDDLRQKLQASVIIEADAIFNEAGATANHTERVTWAVRAMRETDTVALEMLKAVLAANDSVTVATITGASDATIQTNVSAVVDNFALNAPA